MIYIMREDNEYEWAIYSQGERQSSEATDNCI